MTWRSVMISRPANLRRDKFALLIEQEDDARVPFEDIAVIVLNHREITLSHSVLSACGEYGIGLFSIGPTHHPNGVFLPFLSHSRATRVLRLQLALGKPAAKRAWQTIIQSKIQNQAKCLERLGKPGTERLESLARRVRSGDPDNLESQASAAYFRALYGNDFHRGQPRWINAAMDYGYAVFRAAIARGLVAHGFLPALGLFHASEQNAFNLADDLIEPYRPLVDLHVTEHSFGHDVDDLQPADKVALVNLLNVDMAMPRGTTSALTSIEQAVESLARLYEGGSAELLELPRLIGLALHQYEC
ncbi:type II CRISPR-associated endonuclease Cas1 [Thiobacillus sedimenti]|uniref:CRISPR-associated endonuclease Cas1 n=1 Tax=Thiobacillus sedimenti TaxID=3110231 RepID=A0ABZ1CJY9_9PROT|nr:type II CRISPR-associated endonuclease Cas1 [Thiobacillus sp. SCUT-2]WRS38592.1 type II CRISPR-associated endonuclease Cas1 [Thiobacillus sp. SCUT-2]